MKTLVQLVQSIFSIVNHAYQRIKKTLVQLLVHWYSIGTALVQILKLNIYSIGTRLVQILKLNIYPLRLSVPIVPMKNIRALGIGG